MPYSVITIKSDGYVGAPGWTKMHYWDLLTPSAAANAAAAFKTFLGAVAAFTPSGMTYTFQPIYQQFEDDGTLLAEASYSPVPAVTSGSASGAYAGGSGCCVFWNTTGLNGGHKIRGRTYLVPLGNSAYDNTGTLGSVAQGNIQAAATALVGSAIPLAVNSRAKGKPGRTNQTVQVTGATVPDRSAFLRSRRS